MPTVARRPVALVAAGLLAGCAAIVAYTAVTDSTSGRVTPMTKQQQFDQFKSQFHSK